MRAGWLIALLLLAACDPLVASTSTATSASRACQLPVWWGVNTDVGVALVSVPDGAISGQRTLPPPPQGASPALSSFQFYGATYQSRSKTWLRMNRALLSPDGRQYA